METIEDKLEVANTNNVYETNAEQIKNGQK